MFDRSIGVAGLALSLLFWVAPSFWPQLPAWAASAGLMGGVFLLGASAALLIAHKSNTKSHQFVKTATLRLHVFSDHRVPEALQAENVFRWYYLRQALVMLSNDGQEQVRHPITTLFISFEPEVVVSTLKVRSPNLQLPPHEVKEFNHRFAIIVFGGELNEGTLEIAVEPLR